MTASSAIHDTFVLRRSFPVPVSAVFRAWSDPVRKARWFGGGTPESSTSGYQLDFRVGGREFLRAGPPDGPTFTYEADVRDISTDERIVYTYEMHMDDKRISVSVATVEFHATGDTAEVVITEQGVYLDGLDTPAQRKSGTREWLVALAAELAADT